MSTGNCNLLKIIMNASISNISKITNRIACKYWYKEKYKLAYRWFMKAYVLGNKDSIFYLGFISEYGLNIAPKNYDSAKEWYLKGIECDDSSCYVQLGRMYSLGLGVEKDEKKGFQLYKIGADKNDAVGCLNVGYCYLMGQGVDVDYNKAMNYFILGSELGNPDCDENIQYMVDNGMISTKDYEDIYSFVF